jgi:hypothetical protein
MTWASKAKVLASLFLQPRDAEVQQLNSPVGLHKDICGFHVPMDDIALVGIAKRGTHFFNDLQAVD